MTVDDFLVAEFVHHHLGDLIPGAPPDIDHFVVALTLGNQAVFILIFDLFDLSLGLGNDLMLLGRNQHIVGAE